MNSSLARFLREEIEDQSRFDDGPAGERVQCLQCRREARRSELLLPCGMRQIVIRCCFGCRARVVHENSPVVENYDQRRLQHHNYTSQYAPQTAQAALLERLRAHVRTGITEGCLRKALSMTWEEWHRLHGARIRTTTCASLTQRRDEWERKLQADPSLADAEVTAVDMDRANEAIDHAIRRGLTFIQAAAAIGTYAQQLYQLRRRVRPRNRRQLLEWTERLLAL